MKSFLNNFINTKKIHLDFAATTPVAKKVVDAMKPFWNENFYNASASYTAGHDIKKKIKKYRTEISQYVHVKENEIIFTQGGTESINLALLGVVQHALRTVSYIPHVIVSSIEHPAVAECVEYIKTLGVDVEYIPVSRKGIVAVQDFEKMINERTVLVSVIGASNETGVIQPLHKISSSIKKYKNANGRIFNQYPYLHSDVSQLALTHDISITKTGADLLTVDGSKIYAPKMSGFLVKKQYVELTPLIYGGGQEYGLRPGTESITHIVALKTALSLVKDRRQTDLAHFQKLKEYFLQKLSQTPITYEVNGDGEILSHIVNICIPGLNSDFAVIQLDEYGVQCAAMTSCASSKNSLVSEVLVAMKKDECAGSSLRFSFGRSTTTRDLKVAIEKLVKVCQFQKVV